MTASTAISPTVHHALDALAAEDARFTTHPDGMFCPAIVEAQVGCSTYQFQRDTQGTWRLASVNTYGNVQFVKGAGCDASGYVIRDAYTIGELNLIFNTH